MNHISVYGRCQRANSESLPLTGDRIAFRRESKKDFFRNVSHLLVLANATIKNEICVTIWSLDQDNIVYECPKAKS